MIGGSKTKVPQRDHWRTPRWLVNQLASLLTVQFVLDPCACAESSHGWDFIDEQENGLTTDWQMKIFQNLSGDCVFNPAVFVNPPFSELDQWIDKAIEESQKGLTVVMVHPDTRDTNWFQKIEQHCVLQLVPTQRINYVHPETGQQQSGVNFHSCISVFNAWPKVHTQQLRFVLDKPGKTTANKVMK